MKLSVKDICLTAIFTAIITVMAQISIPMPYGVPMTMQTFAIPLAGIVLARKKGTLAVLIYILLGAFGLPVFAGFRGGLNTVFGPTGGFILSFPIMALLSGIGAKSDNKGWLSFCLVAGMTINFLCGMFIYSLVTASSLYTAFIACVLPFLATGFIKLILAGILGIQIKNSLIKEKSLI